MIGSKYLFNSIIKMKNLIFALLILLSVCVEAFAQEKTLINREQVIKEWNKLDTFIKKVKEIVPEFAFQATLLWDGKIISSKKMGYANRETKRPFDEKTIFMWGSISKMFTSLAILQLIEKGKLDLDDPVTRYLPELKQASKKFGGFENVKIHHLLNHTSGLSLKPCYDSLEAKGISHIPSVKEMLPYLSYAQLYWKPGTKYRYSNGGYSLLGVIVEKVTKKKFTEYVTNKIFRLLGMKTAHYGTTSKKMSRHLSHTYYRDTDGVIKAKQFNKPQGFQEGNGGIKSNMPDMLKFLDFLRFHQRSKYLKKYEQVLKTKTFKKFYSNVDLSVPSNKFSISYQVKGEGIMAKISGFDYIKLNTVKGSLYGHTGNIENYKSICYYRSEVPMGLLVMINTSGSNKTKEALAYNRLYSSLNYFATRGKLVTNFYNWPKKKKK